MKYTTVAGKKLSAMSLGTVQLGMNYGIANNDGQPSLEKSFTMLKAALEDGVSSLDTAREYGDAEKVLGDFFKTYKGDLPFITTKVYGVESDNAGEIEKYIVNSAEKSLECMGLDKVNCIMLHTAGDLVRSGKKIADGFESLIRRGYTDTVGVSVYNGSEIEKMLEYDVFTATQIPMSIFDQRLINSGITDKLDARHINTFVRSVFLQGLFFLDPDMVDDPILVKEAVPGIRALRKCAADEGMTVAELAIAFIRDVPGVTSLVLGADTADQVKSNIAYFNTKRISEKTNAVIHDTFRNVDIPEIMKVLSRPKK